MTYVGRLDAPRTSGSSPAPRATWTTSSHPGCLHAAFVRSQLGARSHVRNRHRGRAMVLPGVVAVLTRTSQRMPASLPPGNDRGRIRRGRGSPRSRPRHGALRRGADRDRPRGEPARRRTPPSSSSSTTTRSTPCSISALRAKRELRESPRTSTSAGRARAATSPAPSPPPRRWSALSLLDPATRRGASRASRRDRRATTPTRISSPCTARRRSPTGPSPSSRTRLAATRDRIRVVVPDVGGAFGSKGAIGPGGGRGCRRGHCVLGRPVKLGRGPPRELPRRLPGPRSGGGRRARRRSRTGASSHSVPAALRRPRRLPLPDDGGSAAHDRDAAHRRPTQSRPPRSRWSARRRTRCRPARTGGRAGRRRRSSSSASSREARAVLGSIRSRLRRLNFVPADAFPYETPLGWVYDSGDFERCLDRCARALRPRSPACGAQPRAEPTAGAPGIGIGM